FGRANVHSGIGGQGASMLVPTLLEWGSEAQKQTYIAPTVRGEMMWCQGYSEPSAGSDLAALGTQALLDGDNYVINGQKIWTSTAKSAQMMFCLVRTDSEAKKHLGISYILIPMDTPGLEVRPLVTMTGHAEFNEVFFTDVTVPASNLVGEAGQGWQVANSTLKHERGMLGDPDATLKRFNRLVDMLSEETVDAVPLIDNRLYRDRLMRLQGQLLKMRFNSLRLLTAGAEKRADALMAQLIVKLNGCELNHQICALAIDALEEFGTLYSEGEHLRNTGQWQWDYMFQLGLIIGGGTAQIQKNIISERGLSMPREPKAQPRAAGDAGAGT
ncbi:MAG: acyl-CoA dehydrogenase family protein, partial [Gammaproteobacteria bacterium]